MNYQTLVKIVLAITLIFLLSSCGFKLRRPEAIPRQIHRLHLSTKNPYSPFTTQLKAMLRSLNIVPVKEDGNYKLEISHYRFLQSNPAVTTTTLAATFTYYLTLQIALLGPRGKVIVPKKSLSGSRSIVQNPSQVYTPGTATLMKQELQRDLISQIYYFLVSENTQKALDRGGPPKKSSSPSKPPENIHSPKQIRIYSKLKERILLKKDAFKRNQATQHAT